MDVALISHGRDSLAALEEGLARKGFRIECFPEVGDFLPAARVQSWALVILDGASLSFQEPVEQLLEINASLNIAVVTDLEPKAFHEASEGLGILCAYPRAPGSIRPPSPASGRFLEGA